MKNQIVLIVAAGFIVLVINFTQAQTGEPKAQVSPVYYADGSPAPNVHMVIGKIPIPGGPMDGAPIEDFSVTLVGAAAFTGADSYKCFASKPFGAGLLTGGLFRIVDGSHFAFRSSRSGPAWQQDYFCIGN